MELSEGELATIIRAIHSIDASAERTADAIADLLAAVERIERKLEAGED